MSRKAHKRTPYVARDTKTHPLLVLLSDARFKRLTLSLIAALALVLFIFFAASGADHAAFITVVIAGTLGFIIWALPNVQLSLTAAFLFFQPLFFWPGNSDYNYSKIFITVWLISLIALIWIGRSAMQKRLELDFTPLILPGILVLIAALISLTQSAALTVDLQYVVLFIFYAIFSLTLVNGLKTTSEVRVLIGALTFSATIASLYGLLQYFGILAGFPGQENGTDAIISTFGNRSFLAGFLAYLFSLGLVLLFESRAQWVHSLIIIALAIEFSALVAINSDSAWLALTFSSIAILLALWLTGNLPHMLKHIRKYMALLGAILIATLGLLSGTAIFLSGESFSLASIVEATSAFSPTMWIGLASLVLLPMAAWMHRLITSAPKPQMLMGAVVAAIIVAVIGVTISPIGNGVVNNLIQVATKKTAYLRAQNWLMSWEMFKDHPLTGIGIGDFKREFLPYKAEFYSTELGQFFLENLDHEVVSAHAHNEYVQFGAEMGILGLLAIIAFLVVLGWRLVRILHDKASTQYLWIAAGLFAGLIGFLSDSFFSFPMHIPSNALVFVVIIGALFSRALNPDFSTKLVVSGIGIASTAVGVGLFVIAGSFFAYRDWRADLELYRGSVLMTQGGSRAEWHLQESLRLDPTPEEVLYKLGTFYFQQGDILRSREFLEQSLPVYRREDSYYYLAIISSRVGAIETAQQYLSTLISFNPAPALKYERVPHLQALLHFEQGNSDRAIALLEQVLDRGYQPEVIHLDLAQIYMEQNEEVDARAHLTAAMSAIEQELQSLEQSNEHERIRREELLQLKKGAEELLRLLPD